MRFLDVVLGVPIVNGIVTLLIVIGLALGIGGCGQSSTVERAPKWLTVPAGTLLISKEYEFGTINYYTAEDVQMRRQYFLGFDTTVRAVGMLTPKKGLDLRWDHCTYQTVVWHTKCQTAEGPVGISHSEQLRSIAGIYRGSYPFRTYLIHLAKPQTKRPK